MQTGTKISLAGHGLLVGWVAFGAWLPSEPLPLPVQEVAVISAQEFARLSQQIQAPEVTETPSNLTPPETTLAPPDLPLRPETRPDTSIPDATSEPVVDAPMPALPEPEPEPEVADTLPEPVTPSETLPESPAIVPSQPVQELVRPAERVAPVPVEAPEEEVAIDDLVQPEVNPDEGALSEQEVQEATAPEAASDRIVTEANESDEAEPAPPVTAPLTSVRPKTRPRRPAPAEVAETTPAAPQEDQSSAIEDALAAAIAGGGEVAAPEPSGPPLTVGEKDALRVSVSKCWNVGSLSTEALKTTVEVAVSLDPDGRPKTSTIRMMSSTGGSTNAAKQAYEAARRAIIRCGAKGFSLPSEKYDHWRDIVMTFNPEKMRIK
ncbi:energy transducer TonB [Pseudophaeobacter sp.]|uniref:energy transducer TonB n=1 Tax=Pseudophaeobacter sp. TaxID=1971739 RepID=UPI003298B0FB